MPSEERPRERFIQFGPQSVSTAELLAIVIHTGSADRSAIGLAQELIREHRGLRGIANATVEQLQSVKGVGPAKAVQVAACIELGRRLAREVVQERGPICRPEDAAELLMPRLRDAREERFAALLLDVKARLIRDATVSVGSLDASIVHPREVFREAVTAGAASVIVAHNHPSGDPTPSAEDVRVTRRLVESGQIVGIEVLDHIVIGDGRWVSLKQQGLM